jgi:hypothetical protein
MKPAPRLLQSLRFLPEPTKRKLRPLFRQVVSAIRRLPGGQLPGKALRMLAPGAHRWLLRRYVGYQEMAAIVAQFEQPNAAPSLLQSFGFLPAEQATPAQARPPAGLPADALLSYARLHAIAMRSH